MPAPVLSADNRARSSTFNYASPAMEFKTKASSRLPPRHHRNDSIDSSSSPSPPASSSSSTCSTAPSSIAGISIMKPSSSRRRIPSVDLFADTAFEAHLQDIYAGRADFHDGLSFFETHGYYDVPEANTVDMFRQNFGMKKQFWDGGDHDIMFYEEVNLETVDLAGLQVLSVGTLLSKKLTRPRSTSGRFHVLDDEGNQVDTEAQLEAEKEKRMKLKHMELDDDDLEELAQSQVVLAQAITVIRTEQTRFKRYFFEACTEEMNRANNAAVIPQPMPTPEISVPSYSGYLYVLKDTIPHVFRSWHKRWVYLDFDKGLAMMYKRSYWKSARGVLDMRSVRSITRMNLSDICIQCYDGRSMLFRTKDGSADADLWLNLLQVARRKFGAAGTGSSIVVSPGALQLAQPMAEKQLLTTTTTTTTTTMAAGSILISTKVGKPTESSVLDMMALYLESKSSSSSTTTTAGTNNSVTAA